MRIDYLRYQMIPPRLLKHKMHMCRPPRMSLQQLQQLSHRPIMRNRVWHRNNSIEPKYTVFITLHHTSAIWSLPICVLHVVMSCAICLPDIDLHTLNRISVHVLHGADYQTGLAFRIMRHVIAICHIFCFMSVEWPKN